MGATIMIGRGRLLDFRMDGGIFYRVEPVERDRRHYGWTVKSSRMDISLSVKVLPEFFTVIPSLTQSSAPQSINNEGLTLMKGGLLFVHHLLKSFVIYVITRRHKFVEGFWSVCAGDPPS